MLKKDTSWATISSTSTPLPAHSIDIYDVDIIKSIWQTCLWQLLFSSKNYQLGLNTPRRYLPPPDGTTTAAVRTAAAKNFSKITAPLGGDVGQGQSTWSPRDVSPPRFVWGSTSPAFWLALPVRFLSPPPRRCRRKPTAKRLGFRPAIVFFCLFTFKN